MSTLTLAHARTVVEAAVDASERADRPISVCVVDRQGNEILGLRLDGASWFSIGIAREKARTAAVFERPSASLESLRSEYPTLLPLIEAQVAFQPTTLAGGVPIVRDGQTVGAVGVAGGLPELDLSIAETAVASL